MSQLKGLMLFFICSLPVWAFGQTGTSGNPYTALGHAHNAPTSGIYHFNIGGTVFSTYVEAGAGWILIASGSTATTETSYPTTSNLTLQSDKMLPTSIYNTSSLVTGVRMNATSGPDIPFDVQSTATGVLNNLKNNRTLSVNTNYTDWTGTGTARLQRSCPGNNRPLSTHIYHACGLGTNMHWQVGQSDIHERVNLNSGAKNNLNLWVRANAIPLPVELLFFRARPAGKTVALNWQTASELNHDHFLVERSTNGKTWETIQRVEGNGNQTELQSYSVIDPQPHLGTSYYRLQQVDRDGSVTFSPVESVALLDMGSELVSIFPNPVRTQLTLASEAAALATFKMYSCLGQDVTPLVRVLEQEEHRTVLDLSALAPGVYQLRINSGVHQVHKW